MSLPVDFENKLKQPPLPGAKGYPYQISARDLMQNFNFAAVEIPEFTPSGEVNALRMYTGTGTGGHLVRKLYVEPFSCDTVIPAPP